MKFTCKVVDGKLPEKQKQKIVEFLKKNNGRNIRFEILNADTRSLRLNSYYWEVVVPTIIKYWHEQYSIKHSKDSMNEIIKNNFCFYMRGEEKIIYSTKDLNIAQMIELFKKLDLWCNETFFKGIPRPNDIEEWNNTFR